MSEEKYRVFTTPKELYDWVCKKLENGERVPRRYVIHWMDSVAIEPVWGGAEWTEDILRKRIGNFSDLDDEFADAQVLIECKLILQEMLDREGTQNEQPPDTSGEPGTG